MTLVKLYHETKAAPIRKAEAELSARENELSKRNETIKAREEALNSRLKNLDDTIKLKESQIEELKDIIRDKAPRYHKLFRQLLSQGEQRCDWNKNMARSDQWHNFAERVRIIFESLHNMLFGN